jgi:tRNA 2-thiouridine synthesizing protein E
MPVNKDALVFGDRTYLLDVHGFLEPPEQWDENFAEGMARILGIYSGLSEKHWSFIRYLRRKFIEEKMVPVVVAACADNQLRLSEFRALFPTGYHRGACKIAGINYEFMYRSNIWLTYESRVVLGPRQKMSVLGFLEDFEQWDERFAHFLARELHLNSGLTERHFALIYYLRAYYRKNKNIPLIFEFCRANDLTLEDFDKLFPTGYHRGACRIAGLPCI